MNVVSREQEVVSKYFTNGQTNMDESFKDFQEPKKKCNGPKTGKVVKAKAKPKPKKKIKGQKDIRTALKKNEIVEYTEDFNDICRKSGIDVDSEQLQLAIALSKSLQDTEAESEDLTTKKLTAKQRTGEIKKTLNQYGFKVPANVAVSKKRRVKKCAKESRLLLTSDEEKGQIIADRYAQVLFQNLQTASITQKQEDDLCNIAPLYYKTCAEYKEIKETKVFYVENLFEEYQDSIGSLLRDWTKIPGRPASPTVPKVHELQIIDFDFTEEEMDILLSGTIDLTQKVVLDKIKKNIKTKDCKDNSILLDDIEDNCNKDHDPDCIFVNEANSGKGTNVSVASTKDEGGIQSMIDINLKMDKKLSSETRCESPDLFDDDLTIDASKDGLEVLEIVDEVNNENDVVLVYGTQPDVFSQELSDDELKWKSKDNMDRSESSSVSKKCVKIVDETLSLTQIAYANEHTKRKSDDFMELTKCVNEMTSKTVEILTDTNSVKEKHISPIQITYDLTRRKTNDFMEITDCVARDIIQVPETEENIDLTQHSVDYNDATIIVEHYNETPKNLDKVEMDLTQSTDTDDSLPFVHIGGTTNKTIISTVDYTETIKDCSLTEDIKSKLKENASNSIKNVEKQVLETINVERYSKSSISSDVFDEFHYEHSHSSSENKISVDLTEESVTEHNKVDLTQSSGSTIAELPEILENSPNVTIINDNNDVSISSHITSPNINPEIDIETHNNADMYDDYIDIINDQHIDYNVSKDDTILYDEIDFNKQNINADEEKKTDIEEIKNDSNKDQRNIEEETNIESSQNQNAGLISQNSEVFEISDEELNYSVHKSRHCNIDSSQDIQDNNFDFGGISVLDHIGSLTKFRESTNCEPSTSKAFEESLPIVDIQGTKDSTSTPLKSTKENIVQTPKNSDFIIKMDQVTPMADYASMSTPERNTELDKFGLKPLKRKRAIQLLTHLYNQTHPLVEDTDSPSPSKKLKATSSDDLMKKYNKCVETPKKINFGKVLAKDTVTLEEDATERLIRKDLYKESVNNHVTGSHEKDKKKYHFNGKPALKDIADCDPDDWVFQKREKAKVHSCRVPLHIAFHNYVSSRIALREAILRYEPVNIEEIHKDLVDFGHRYDPKDLLKFMDKKCITVKTADNNARNLNNKVTKKS